MSAAARVAARRLAASSAAATTTSSPSVVGLGGGARAIASRFDPAATATMALRAFSSSSEEGGGGGAAAAPPSGGGGRGSGRGGRGGGGRWGGRGGRGGFGGRGGGGRGRGGRYDRGGPGSPSGGAAGGVGAGERGGRGGGGGGGGESGLSRYLSLRDEQERGVGLEEAGGGPSPGPGKTFSRKPEWRERRRHSGSDGKGRGGTGTDRSGVGPKSNFARDVLDPAFRGQLGRGHDSGIPRLTARKHKGHGVHDAFPGKEAEEVEKDEYPGTDRGYETDPEQRKAEAEVRREPLIDPGGRRMALGEVVRSSYESGARDAAWGGGGRWAGRGGGRGGRGGGRGGRGGRGRPPPPLGPPVPLVDPFTPRPLNKDMALFRDLFDGFLDDELVPKPDPIPTPATGGYEAWYASKPYPERYNEGGRPNKLDIYGTAKRDVRTGHIIPDESSLDRKFYRDIMDFTIPFPDTPDEIANQVRPLADHGPHIDDFMMAIANHPTKYALIERKNEHIESQRRPKRVVPKSRIDPPEDFVRQKGPKAGFLFVSGLRRPVLDGKLGTWDDPVARNEVTDAVSKLFDVGPLQVCPASLTSAFVIFDNYKAAGLAVRATRERRVKNYPVKMAAYVTEAEEGGDDKRPGSAPSEKEREFVGDSDASVVRLEDLPPGMSLPYLLRRLYPAPGDDCPLSVSDVLRTSPSSVLLRFPSPEDAAAALDPSSDLSHRVLELGRHHVRVFPAKRETVWDGWHGPYRGLPSWKMGMKMEVKGDTPTKKFFLSHYDCLHLRAVPPHITKADIARTFQPWSLDHRDVEGSVEWVTCADGLPTGRAFVGFDRPGEAKCVMDARREFNLQIDLDGTGRHPSRLRMVREHLLRRGKKLPPRPARPVEELWDDLHNWEKHADPEDVRKLVEDHGIPKVVLDDVFLTMRCRNPSFGAMDRAIRTERLRPEYRPGGHWARMVNQYVKLLLEVSVTKEDPGLFMHALHYEGEELDLSIFDREEERIRKAVEGREG